MVRAYQVSGRWRQSLLPGLSWSKVCHLIPTVIAGVIRSVLCILTKPFRPGELDDESIPSTKEFVHVCDFRLRTSLELGTHGTITLAKSDLPFRSETHLLIFLSPLRAASGENEREGRQDHQDHQDRQSLHGGGSQDHQSRQSLHGGGPFERLERGYMPPDIGHTWLEG